jgi:TetR/AcrR family transcriptional regulator
LVQATPPSPAAIPAAAPQRKGERTAERILDAAEALFAERGFAGTTLRDVASRVGLRNPSLYNHFANKQALYAAVLERGLEPVLAALSDAVIGDEAPDPEAIIHTVMQAVAKRPSLARLVLHETLSGGESLTPMLTEWIGPVLERGQQMLRANPGASRWSEEQIPLLVLAFYNIVVGYFTTASVYQRLSGNDLLDPAAVERQTDVLRALVAALFSDDQQERPPTR